MTFVPELTDGIRRYGPGKFDTILDSYVYDVSLDRGCDCEAGSVSENGLWIGLMRNGSTIFKDHDPCQEPLNDTERDLLTRSAGVILTEDVQGFVSVTYYETDEELDSDWSDLLSHIE